jgi:restriction system protein
MPVPPYQDLLQPIVRILSSEGEELSKDQLVERLVVELVLNEHDAHERLPSGSGTILEHNIDWARSHLQMQGLIEGSLERGLRLTAKGWSYAGKYFPEMLRQRYAAPAPAAADGQNSLETATRLLGLGRRNDASLCDETASLNHLRQLNDELALVLIDRVCRQSPDFFELLVIDLIRAMGYGRGQPNLAQKLGRTGDGGVDGVVAMDELGLDLVYLQAKRYRPEIPVPVAAVRDFVGSLDAKRATRGAYFTTSFFPASAYEYVSQSTFRVALIDGPQIAQLMMHHNIGVRIKDEIKIRRIDESYFAA